MIQIHDISKSIMIEYLQTEKELYEIINATVSHEMRNPINSMVYQNENIMYVLNQVVEMLSGLPQCAVIKKVKKKSTEMTRSLQVMKHSSKLLLFFVQDLLDFAQIKQKKFKKNIEDFSPQEAIDELCQVLAFQSESKNVAITQVFRNFISDSGELVFTDKQRLQQCVLNLLSNALKFTDVGGTIQISTELRYNVLTKDN